MFLNRRSEQLVGCISVDQHTIQEPLRLVVISLEPPLDDDILLPSLRLQLDLRLRLLCSLFDV